jgi:hypothetical protein
MEAIEEAPGTPATSVENLRRVGEVGSRRAGEDHRCPPEHAIVLMEMRYHVGPALHESQLIQDGQPGASVVRPQADHYLDRFPKLIGRRDGLRSQEARPTTEARDKVFKSASQASGDLIGSVNIGGKDVIKTKNTSGSFSYLYVRNDVILGVTVKDDAAAAAALAVLP